MSKSGTSRRIPQLQPRYNYFMCKAQTTISKLRDETEDTHPLVGPNSITHWAPPRLHTELKHIIGGLNSGDLSPSATADILEDILLEETS